MDSEFKRKGMCNIADEMIQHTFMEWTLQSKSINNYNMEGIPNIIDYIFMAWIGVLCRIRHGPFVR